MSQIATHVRKATSADGYRRCRCNEWTAEMDGHLEILLADHSIVECARIMTLPASRVYDRVKVLGLAPVPEHDKNTPSIAEWRIAATRKAMEAKVRPEAVLGKDRERAVARARWAAWRELLDSDPNYSMAGLERVTGCDRASIMYGLKRLNGASAKRASSRAKLEAE